MMTLLFIAIGLYLAGAVCAMCVILFLICLGGQNPSFPQVLHGLLLIVFWPIAVPWMMISCICQIFMR